MTKQPRAHHIATATLVVAAGAGLAMMISTWMAAMLLLLVLIRICWIEDNIHSDLIHADRLPQSYINTGRRRQRLLWALFRIRPESDPKDWCPRMLASAQRAQAQAWTASLFGALAILAANQVAVTPWFSCCGAAVMLAIALRKADRLSWSLLALDDKEPLPTDTIRSRAPSTFFSNQVNRPD